MSKAPNYRRDQSDERRPSSPTYYKGERNTSSNNQRFDSW